MAEENGWRERMDRFERGLGHLFETQARHEGMIDRLLQAQRTALDSINALARIAESHERRIEGLEGAS